LFAVEYRLCLIIYLKGDVLVENDYIRTDPDYGYIRDEEEVRR